MATWAELEASAPALAEAGARLLRRGEIDEALLATVSGDQLPRINPIYVRVVGGRLYAFILHSAKLTDLERDGRYALHTHQDPASPSEFSVRGRARIVSDPASRERVDGEWYFSIDDTYVLVEFDISHALLGERNDADEWPPRYTSWRAPAEATAQ